MQVPAQAAEDLLAQPVAVAGDFGGVVLVAVAFDAEREDARMAGVPDADVDPVPGGADLRCDLVSPGADDAMTDSSNGDSASPPVLGVQGEGGDAAGGVVEVAAQVPDALPW